MYLILGPATLRWLAVEEDGAAYTLSYVMVIPTYALLLCMIIESVLMLVAKLGTEYSAFAAARTASVWSSATTWEKAMEKAKAAATKSMTPFASGTHGGLTKAVSVDALAYVAAYEAYGKHSISEKYLLSKYGYARSTSRSRSMARPNIGIQISPPKSRMNFRSTFPESPVCSVSAGPRKLLLQPHIRSNGAQRRPARRPQNDWNRLWNARIKQLATLSPQRERVLNASAIARAKSRSSRCSPFLV